MRCSVQGNRLHNLNRQNLRIVNPSESAGTAAIGRKIKDELLSGGFIWLK